MSDMAKVIFKKDIQTICVVAKSFPNDILTAFETLHTLLTDTEKRQHFGISHSNTEGGIHYMAAATELQKGEAKALGLDNFTIKKGTYNGMLIPDFRHDVSEIGRTFERLLQDPNIDPQGYCLEIYEHDTDVHCLVKLKDQTSTKQNTIEEYINQFPAETQTLWQQVRTSIKEVVPTVEESISYGIPKFSLNGQYIVYCAAYKKHIGIYPIPKGDEAFDKAILPYKKAKSTLQLPLNKPLPLDLIKQLVAFSVHEKVDILAS
jgi:uncharacterized protein YdhG (YjbR/CyaY superfamily)